MIRVPQPVAFDNTALASFSCIGRMDLLQHAFNQAVVLDEVVNESRFPGWLRNPVDTALNAGWLQQRSLQATDQATYASFRKKLHVGESACLAWLTSQGAGTFVTDDFASMKAAKASGFSVVTTLGILYHHYAIGALAEPLADQYLQTMQGPPRNAQFPSLVQSFGDVITQFRTPKAGRKLV